MVTFLLVIILLCFIGPWLYRLLLPVITRWAVRRMTRHFARQAGIGPDETPGHGKRRKTTARSYRQEEARNAHPHSGPIIPKEYAEDVEFVEIREYASSQTVIEGSPSSGAKRRKGTVKSESQVSDAEIIEIRK